MMLDGLDLTWPVLGTGLLVMLAFGPTRKLLGLIVLLVFLFVALLEHVNPLRD